MMFDPPVPLRYDPSIEQPEKDEEEVQQGLLDTMQTIREKTFADGGHAIRSVHAKSHGLLQGELEVYDEMPAVLKQGLFAHGGVYPVVMRFSTIPGDVLDDKVSTPRGLAVKIIGVEGERLPGAEGATQDLVLGDGPVFSAPNAKGFLANLKMLAATTDKIEGVKKALSAALRPIEKLVEAAGGESPTLSTLGGRQPTHVLGGTYYSQTPILYGDYIAKVAIAPISPELKALEEETVDLEQPNALREAVEQFFRTHGGEWELRIQFAIDHEHTPVENASKAWPEDKSPYIPVGRITAKPQTAWSEARSAAVDDGLSFSPWHGLAAHRPLGSIMRARKAAYEQSVKFRNEHNSVPMQEPRSFQPLPG